MHNECREFTLFIQKILVNYFCNKLVLDVGAGDINGNNRFLFENCEYNGNDVIQAPNVTIVSKTKDLPFHSNTFDTIMSTECFEHDPEYKESFIKIYDMLKPDGLFLFTCASTDRPEHGTRRTCAQASYGTIGNLLDMQDYYKNLTETDLNEVLPLNNLFSVWDTYYNSSSNDLYFVGIKKGISTPDALENVLKTISSIRTRNETVYTVVGCGGDRDTTKRPKMAGIACELSDKVIITSDNPRSEDPNTIIEEMMVGVEGQHFKKTLSIVDREQAIKTAVLMADKGDIILIAGKGHEKYQDIKGIKHHFDDMEIVTELFNKLEK